ncbi:MAG: pseudouridine synthase [Planctomycetota bacterium]|nr:pseudouridine synthase [Planctomycetota bacterium]
MAKEYQAIINGSFAVAEFLAAVPPGKNVNSRVAIRRAVVAKGSHRAQAARSSCRVQQRFFSKHTLLSLVPHAGRTHQLRVHLAHVAHPLSGDKRYGSSAAE